VSHHGRRRWRRRVVLGSALALGAVLLSACGSGGNAGASSPKTVPAVGGTVTVGTDQAATGCNPNTPEGNTAADRLILAEVLPSAFEVNGLGVSQYDSDVITQAELQSTSPQTVVYTIDPKAVWSDGVPITATDFVYAWQHQIANPFVDTSQNVASTAGYSDIQSVTGSNKGQTVTVVFSTPYADWQSLFNDMVPAHVMDRIGWNPPCASVDPAIDLSGGPYLIHSVATDGTVVLVRNPRWWGQKPNLARVVVKVASGDAQLARWLRRGVVDVAVPGSFSGGFLAMVTSMPWVMSTVGISTQFLELDFANGLGATINPYLRQGIAYALDRQDIATRVVGFADAAIAPSVSHLYSQEQNAYPGSSSSTSTLATAPSPSTTTTIVSAATSFVSSGKAFPTEANASQAVIDLTQAGYVQTVSGSWTDTLGRPLVLRLAVDSADQWAVTTGALVAQQLEHAGIAITMVPEASASATGGSLDNGSADLAVVPRQAGPYTSETGAWYSTLLDAPGASGLQDWTGYASTKVNTLFLQASQKLDPVAAAPLYDSIDSQLWASMVSLPLFAEPVALAWSSRIAGLSAVSYVPGLFTNLVNWARQVQVPASYEGTPTIPGH
jgi:peptide/nickel transport system substrate-binding protein